VTLRGRRARRSTGWSRPRRVPCARGAPAALFALACLASAAHAAGTIAALDPHVHVFNFRYLPVEGILLSRGVPALVAMLVARGLERGTRLADLDGSPDALLAADVEAIAALSEDEVRSRIRARLRSGLADEVPLSEEERRALRRYAGVTGAEAADLPPGAGGDAELLARAIEKAPLDPEGAGGDEAAATALGGAAGRETSALCPRTGKRAYLHFVWLLMQDEITVVRQLAGDFPGTALFVHHLMDMERAYADPPAIPFDEQVRRARRLESRFFPGRLLHFTAFDPFRGAAALDEVRRAVAAGAIGVKFYPPTGYRAAANVIPAKPWFWQRGARAQWKSRYQLADGSTIRAAELDRRIEELLSWAESEKVPVLAHCTPDGFEARRGYGCNSDPRFWRAALERHPRLRLMLGHAGGGEGWFAPGTSWDGVRTATCRGPGDPARRATFDEEAWRLAIEFENVYLDFSYASEVLDPECAARFTARLAHLVARGGADRHRLEEKVAFGTDWHMIGLLERRAEIASALAAVYEQPTLAPHAASFFAGNAARFLDLEAAARRADRLPAERAGLEAFLASLGGPP
jgi:predicted TIM-barrel fold metal-dependent hydrolase